MASGGDLFSLLGAGYGYNELQKNLDQQQKDVDTGLGYLTSGVMSGTEFKPYGVTSGIGSSTVGPNGLTMNLSPLAQATQDTLGGAGVSEMLKSTQGSAARQDQLYQAMNATMSPEQQRAKAAMDAQLRASGRSGMFSNMYGGSPEQLAYAKALEEAKAGNWLKSGTLANQELDSQYTRGAGLYKNAFIPQEFLMEQGKMGLTGANEANSQNLARWGLMSDLGKMGMESDINYSNIKANNFASLFGGMTGSNGLFSSIGDIVGGGEGGWLDDAIGGVGDWIGGLFGSSNNSGGSRGTGRPGGG